MASATVATKPTTSRVPQRAANLSARARARRVKYMSMWVDGLRECAAACEHSLTAQRKLLKIYEATPKDIAQEIEASMPPRLRRRARRGLV